MSQQRVITLALFTGLFVSFATASAAEALNATVVNASGETAIINVGSANGIAAGSRFRVFSIGKMVRIPLTGTVVYTEGEPVGVIRVIDVAESTARCKVEATEPGKQIKPGHSAIYISRPTRGAAPLTSGAGGDTLEDGELADSSDFDTDSSTRERTPTPDGYLPSPDIIRIGLKAEPSMPTPGKVVKISIRGLERAAPGYSVFWTCSAGSFAMPLSSKATNEWTSPRMAGRYQLTAEVSLADGKKLEGRGVIEVTGTAELNSEYKIERIIGYKVVENKAALSPRDLAVDELGNCFYIDASQRCVFMLGRSGTFGAAASATECIQAGVKNPIAIAARAGRIYLLDTAKPYVKVFTMKGFERGIADGGEVKTPTDITVDGRGRVFILDRPSRSFHVYNAAGKYLRSRGSRGRSIGRFDTPVALDVAANGNILVLDTRARKVQVFDPDLSAISQISLRATRNLLDIAAAPKGDKFYILEGPKRGIVATYSTSGNGTVISYPVSDKKKFKDLPPKVLRLAADDIGRIQVIGTGVGVVRYTEDGLKAGSFGTQKPGDVHKIAVGEDGYFAVLDEDAPHLRLYDPGGWLINRFGSRSDRPIGLSFPNRLTISRSGGAVSTLGKFSRSPFSRGKADPVLYLFDKKGNYLRRLCRQGRSPGELIEPLDVATDRQGYVYTLDRNRIQRFETTGTSSTPDRHMEIDIGSRNPHEMHRPYRFTIDPDTREFYIYDYKRRIIKKFASDLSYIGETGTEISLGRVERMVTGHMGGLWVFDSKLRKIIRIDFRKTLAQTPFEFDPGNIKGAIVDFGVDGSGRLYVLTNHDIIYVYR